MVTPAHTTVIHFVTITKSPDSKQTILISSTNKWHQHGLYGNWKYPSWVPVTTCQASRCLSLSNSWRQVAFTFQCSPLEECQRPLEHSCVCTELLQSCLTLGNPMDCSPPGSSVCGILQARILEWVAIPFSRESSQPRDQICISFVLCIGKQVL